MIKYNYRIGSLILILTCIALISCRRKKLSSPAPVLPVPSENQLAWLKWKQTLSSIFTANTFTGREGDTA